MTKPLTKAKRWAKKAVGSSDKELERLCREWSAIGYEAGYIQAIMGEERWA